jgi:putative PEP-CTERM system TPR-repeat lipoprotein
LVAIAISATLLMASGCQKQSAQDHIEQAQVYINEGDNDAAVIELKNAIQQNTELSEPRVLIGKIYLQRGDFLQAQHEFRRAKNSGHDPLIVEPLLVRSYLAAEDTVNTIEFVDDSDVTLPEVKSELLAMKSLALLFLDEKEQATIALDQAANLTNSGYYYALANARILAFDGEYEQALQILEPTVEREPSNSDGWLLMGHVYSADGQHGEAAKAYQKAIDLSPIAVQYQLRLARALIRDGQYDNAEPIIDNLFALSPDNMLVNELRAVLYYSRQQLADAGSAAEIALQKGSSNLQLELIAGVAAIDKNNYPSAVRHLEPVIPFVNSDHFANRLYAVALFESGEIEKARQFLSYMAEGSERHDEFIVNMGREFQKMGRVDITQSLLTETSTNNLSQHGQAQVALMKISQNDSSGLSELQTLIDQQPEFSNGTQAIVFYHIASDDLEKAEQVNQEWLAREPDNAKASLMQGMIDQRKGNLDSALSYATKSLEQDPEDSRTILLLAELYMQTEQTDKAYTLLYDSARQYPDDSRIARGLFIVAAQNGKTDQVLELYKEVSKEPGQQDMLAKAYAASGDPTSAIEVLESIPVNSRDADSYALLSRLYASVGDTKQAESATEKWVEAAPNNRLALEQLFTLYGRNEKYQAAVGISERLEQLFPNNPTYTSDKARMYVAQKKFTMAMDTLNDRSDWNGREIEREWAMANVYAEKGEHRKATPLYERVFETSPNSRTALALSRSYSQSGRNDKATALLTGLIEQEIPGYESLELMLAQLELEQDPSNATRKYLALLEKNPNNLVALNNIAWTYIEAGQIDEACGYAERAYQMATEMPQVQDTYGYCLLKQGKIEEGGPLIEKAYKALSNEDEVSLHYAELLLMERRNTESKAILQKVTTTDQRLLVLKQKLEQQLEK